MKRTIDLTMEQYEELCKRGKDLTIGEEYKMCWFEVLNILNKDTKSSKAILEGYMKKIENIEMLLIKNKSTLIPKWRLKEIKEAKKVSVKNCVCDKCGGSGIIPAYSHIDGGICFKCKGTGKR